MRQALAGMLWSKQCYYFDVDRWLRERSAHPLRGSMRRGSRNESWFHMVNYDVVSMPDKWEYPWYAAWDLAFHCIPLAMVDPDFAKHQIQLMISQEYLHPSGQMPAYEWNFGDVNPPVHAFAALFLHRLESERGEADLPFVQECFSRLLVNFTWWVNRKDPTGRNVFEGGFLGLDNIGVFDRSAALPTGGRLEQADGTAWMAMFSQNMLELALAVLEHDPAYEDFVLKFVEHFFWIAAAVDPVGRAPGRDVGRGGRFLLRRAPSPGRHRHPAQGEIARRAAASVRDDRDRRRRDRALSADRRGRSARSWSATTTCSPTSPTRLRPAWTGRRILSLVNEDKLRRILHRMLDEERFLGPHGIRSISRWHLDHPYSFDVDGVEHRVQYEPAESTSGMFGGNSNWRGPVWFPINLLLIRALLQHYRYYGDDLKIECPTGSGTMMTLFEVAQELITPARRDLPARRRRATSGLRRDQALSGGSALAGPDPVLRVLPRRQRGRARRLAPNRMDRPRRQADPEPRPARRRRRARGPSLAVRPAVPPARGRSQASAPPPTGVR